MMSECVSVANASNITFYEVVNDETEEKRYMSLERRFLDYMGVCRGQKGEHSGVMSL